MKKLLLLALLLALAAYGLAAVGGSLLAKGIEVGGKFSTGAETKVGSALVKPWSGEFSVSGLSIGNPEGFKTETSLRADSIRVTAKLGTLLDDVIVIDRIVIEEPEVTLEMAAGGTNLGKLLKKLESMRGDKGSSKSLEVGTVVIQRPKVRLAQSILLQAEQTIQLGDLTLKDIGGKGDQKRAVTLSELIALIFARISGAVGGDGGVPNELKNLLSGETPKALADELKQTLDDALKDVSDQLGDLFGGDKK